MRLEIKKLPKNKPTFNESNYDEYVKHIEEVMYLSKEYTVIEDYDEYTKQHPIHTVSNNIYNTSKSKDTCCTTKSKKLKDTTYGIRKKK